MSGTVVRYRVCYGRVREVMHERLFATYAAARSFAQRKMSDPGWRIAGWPVKVEVPAIAAATGEQP